MGRPLQKWNRICPLLEQTCTGTNWLGCVTAVSQPVIPLPTLRYTGNSKVVVVQFQCCFAKRRHSVWIDFKAVLDLSIAFHMMDHIPCLFSHTFQSPQLINLTFS